MTRTVSVLHDRELVELLADEPELLAIADAIVAGRPASVPNRRSRLAALVVAIAAVVAATLVAPWSNSRGGVIQKALAAVTTRSVLHVVLVSRIPGVETIDLETGRATPTALRIEQWFDTRRGLDRYTVDRAGVTHAYLETPHGVWSADPALAAFLTGYRAALSSGAARYLGPGRVGGRPVFWIGFALEGSKPRRTERVAVSRATFRPLRIETATDGKVGVRADVVRIDTLPYRAALFVRPSVHRRPAPVAGEVAATRHVSRAVAEQGLGKRARSLGETFGSLPLIDARLDILTTGYGRLSHKHATRAPGVQFLYGDNGLVARKPFLRVSEALSPQFAYGMQPNRTLARANVIVTRIESETSTGGRSLWLGELRTAKLWVSLEASSRSLLLEAAAALNKAR